MELDTGASVSLISEQTYLKAWADSDRPALRQSSKKLHTYTGESIPLKGEIDVKVRAQTKDPTILLSLLVVQRRGCSLLGRDWLCQLTLDWQHTFRVSNSRLEAVLERHKAVFAEELGTYTGPATKIIVDPREWILEPDTYAEFQFPRILLTQQ